MAVKYMRVEDAEQLRVLSQKHGVRESEILTALIWRYGDEAAAAARQAKQAGSALLKGEAVGLASDAS